MPTRYLRGLPIAKAQWIGGTDSNFTCCVMNRVEITTSCLTGADVDDKNPKMWKTMPKEQYGKSLQTEDTFRQSCFTPSWMTVYSLYIESRLTLRTGLCPFMIKLPEFVISNLCDKPAFVNNVDIHRQFLRHQIICNKSGNQI